MTTTHEVICGDAADVLPSLGIKPDLIITSPPYGDLREFGGHGFDFDRVADACVGALKPGGVIVWVVADATVDGSESGTSFRQALGFMERGLKLHDTMIYEKMSSSGKAFSNRYVPAFEYMFVFTGNSGFTFNPIIDLSNSKAGVKTNVGGTRRRDGSLKVRAGGMVPTKSVRTNVWHYATGYRISAPDHLDAHEHPAIFPLALAKDHILTWTNPGDLVLDPMAGSGTVARAAKDLGRNSIAIEIHAPYVDLIHRRLAQGVLL